MRRVVAIAPWLALAVVALLVALRSPAALGQADGRYCAIEGDKTADPSLVELGGTVDVRLTLQPRCATRQGAIVFTRCPP